MLDTSLQPRAAVLHENAAALARQERDVAAAVDGLRREREKLAREAARAARRIKETGNVQNWAEVLERQFLVLEETVRLAGREGSCSCSCSDCGASGSESGSEDGDGDGARRGDDDGHGDDDDGDANGKGKDVDVNMIDSGTAWSMSDASKSIMDVDSSTGTGKARGSDTGSMSTTS